MITKQEIKEYIDLKPHIHAFPYGQFWKCRIGERSLMEGKFTNKDKAEKALYVHVGNSIESMRKLQVKREARTNAKKTKS